MADSTNSGIQQATEETAQAVGEVAKDIKDSVGQAIEQGVQSVVGPKLTPQQILQKQQQDQKDLAEARRKIEWFKKLAQEQNKVRKQEVQKQIQKQQIEEQEQQAKKVENIQTQQAPKKPGKKLSEEVLRTQAEYKPGKGVGG